MSDKIILGISKGRVKLTSCLNDSLFPLNTTYYTTHIFSNILGHEKGMKRLNFVLSANVLVAKS